MNGYDLEVMVSGPNHSGKTSLIALIAKLLEEQGLTGVVLQRIDPQLKEKLYNPEKALDRIKNQRIIICEYNTAF